MLQQTQVSTVIPYYQRFMQALPDVSALAAAPQDQVLQLWTGLGYYARARNLHRAAQIICDANNSNFPDTQEGLEALPGIGRSTAGAILALSMNRRATILDGNVKRVLARHRAIAGWPGQSATLKHLWSVAEAMTPNENVAAYTQAIMDLGASLCSRSRPDCPSCPLNEDCIASLQGNVQDYPGRKPKKNRPRRQRLFALFTHGNRVLLQQRPPSGIWGGLWSFPELEQQAELDSFTQHLGLRTSGQAQPLPQRLHRFTHFDLDIQPLLVPVSQADETLMEDRGLLWYNVHQPLTVGVSTPVVDLIQEFRESLT